MTKCSHLTLAAMLVLALSGCTGSTAVVGGSQPAAPYDAPASASSIGSLETTGSKVVVYNIEGAVGCKCNVIAGEMARQAVEESFESDLAPGRIIWQDVTSRRCPELGQRYGVSGNVILVVGSVDGKDVSQRSLNKVCRVYASQDPFKRHVTTEVGAVLADVKRQDVRPAVSRR